MLTLTFSNSTNPNPFMMRTSVMVPYLSKKVSMSRRVASTVGSNASERQGMRGQQAEQAGERASSAFDALDRLGTETEKR